MIRLPNMPRVEGTARRELVAALREVVSTSPFSRLEDLGHSLQPRWSPQRLSELIRGTQLPDVHQLQAVVRVCRPSAVARLEGLLRAAVAEQRLTVASRRPNLIGWPLVGEVKNAVDLGVHRPITLLATGEDRTAAVDAGMLPAYVTRDQDEQVLRPALREMAGEQPPHPVRLVLVAGQSTAGKSRAAFEAMRAELADWRLFRPPGVGTIKQVLADQVDLRRTVVWLDEIQELLEHPDGAEQLQLLLNLCRGPTVVLATVRADAEDTLSRRPAWARITSAPAVRIPLKRAATHAELDRAGELDDSWIAEAREKITEEGRRHGIAEWLAAGPQLLDRLCRARDGDNHEHQVGAAIVHAAIDFYRAGYTTPIPNALLAEAQGLYLDDPAGTDSAKVFRRSLKWARTPVAGASALLEHQQGHGDRAFDYLIGHAAQHGGPIPPTMWTILARNLTAGTLTTVGLAAFHQNNPALTRELAHRAEKVDRSAAAELYTELADEAGLARLADSPDGVAAVHLAILLRERGDAEGLERLSDKLDELHWSSSDRPGSTREHAARLLVELLAERGDEAGLERRADAGHKDGDAADRLAALLAERGDEAGLERRAAAGDGYAARRLAALLAERGDEAGLERRAAAGDRYASEQLTLLSIGRADELELERLASAGVKHAIKKLATLLWRRGDVAGLERLAADDDAACPLALLLAKRGDEVGLERHADAGNLYAELELADLLAAHGSVDKLWARADAGKPFALEKLVKLLAERGDEVGLERLTNAGNEDAAERLADLLGERGDAAGLEHLVESNHENWQAAERLAQLLAKRGNQTELERLADAGWEAPTERLAELLARRGDEAALERRATSGDHSARSHLAELLASRGDEAGLERLAKFDDYWSPKRLAELRAIRGNPSV